MDIIKFLTNKKQCKHSKIQPQEDIAYCPDCGELIKNEWYITRCLCCGIKIKAILKNGVVTADEKFCHNCGGKEFVAEQISKINCIDINYAVLVKTIIQMETEEYTQSWINSYTKENIRLLT